MVGGDDRERENWFFCPNPPRHRQSGLPARSIPAKAGYSASATIPSLIKGDGMALGYFKYFWLKFY